jgi:hypothetical protein
VTDEPVATGPENAVPSGGARPDEGRVEVVLGETGIPEDPGIRREGPAASPSQLASRSLPVHAFGPEMYLTGTAIAVYSKAFVEALAKRHADGLADRVRTRSRTREARIGLPDSESATIVITARMPDEARLALLDLDVTADEVRGKLLRWDSKASAWRPADDLEVTATDERDRRYRRRDAPEPGPSRMKM